MITKFNQKKGDNMKIRKMWRWGFFVIVAILLSIGIPEAKTEIVRVDEDVGLTADDSRESIVTSFDFNFINEAEVEISPGDNFETVSDWTYENMVETLQGNTIGIIVENDLRTYNESNDMYYRNSYTSNYRTSNKTIYRNSHFALDQEQLEC